MRWILSILVAILSLHTLAAQAAVTIVANRTATAVRFRASADGVEPKDFSVKPADLAPIPSSGPITIAFEDGKQVRRMTVEPNSAYYFGKTAGGEITLQQIGIGDGKAAAAAVSKPSDAKPATFAPPKPLTIDVKLFVDEEETATDRVWQSRLKKRVADVSDILERQCFVRLNVVEYGTWDSDDRRDDFARSVREFEEEASPGKARLAIGFTSQYKPPQGKFHLGGTRGALSKHILIREWSQHVTEEERLEVLLHEVGHFLGASHSPESTSVMRVQLGDRQARARSFHIGLDPLNALAICTVVDDLRRRPLQSPSELSPGAKLLLADIYRELVKSVPQDPSAPEYLKRLNLPGDKPAAATGGATAPMR